MGIKNNIKLIVLRLLETFYILRTEMNVKLLKVIMSKQNDNIKSDSGSNKTTFYVTNFKVDTFISVVPYL